MSLFNEIPGLPSDSLGGGGSTFDYWEGVRDAYKTTHEAAQGPAVLSIGALVGDSVGLQPDFISVE